MFVIESLHPDGWKPIGHATQEYWAYQEAQLRSCSDGRHYRIVDPSCMRVMALVSASRRTTLSERGSLLLR